MVRVVSKFITVSSNRTRDAGFVVYNTTRSGIIHLENGVHMQSYMTSEAVAAAALIMG